MLSINFGLICIIFVIDSIESTFTPHFSQWLTEHFGEDVKNHLERKDLGELGSFGGKAITSDVINKKPVVFVHGVSNRAGDKMKQAADYFYNNGYRFSELYGTTYANGDQGNPLQWATYGMQCSYVKLIRALIVAVRLYTGRAVNVVGYSLGVPVSRKAILGGRCVDTNEELGSPLTRFIDTYVGVAGPNHGIALQLGGISIPGCLFSVIPVCNPITGLYSGLCPAESKFLQNINEQIGYEGQHRYTIYSKADQLVGHLVCGKSTSQIAGQNGEKFYAEKNHDNVLLETFPVLLHMVQHHMII